MKKVFILFLALFLFGAAGAQAAVEFDSASTDGDSPEAEQPKYAFDGDPNTKFLVFSKAPNFLQVKLAKSAVVTTYAITSANDEPARDPKSWELLGSADGENWEVIDQQSGQTFAERFERKQYSTNNAKEYQFYKLNITENGGADIIQLAELELIEGGSGNPKTGDNGVAVYGIIAAISAVVAAGVFYKKKQLTRVG